MQEWDRKVQIKAIFHYTSRLPEDMQRKLILLVLLIVKKAKQVFRFQVFICAETMKVCKCIFALLDALNLHNKIKIKK